MNYVKKRSEKIENNCKQTVFLHNASVENCKPCGFSKGICFFEVAQKDEERPIQIFMYITKEQEVNGTI